MAKAEAQPIKREQLEHVAKRLGNVAKKLADIAAEMSKANDAEFLVTNYPSLLIGLRQVESFRNAAEAGWDDHQFQKISGGASIDAVDPANGNGSDPEQESPPRPPRKKRG